MKKFVWTIMCCLSLLMGVNFTQAQILDDISYMTEEYPPFNFEKGGKLQGIAIDLIEAAFKQAGASKTVGDIELLPWAKSYATVQKKANTCLFSMTRSEAREPLFKWAGPVADARVVLISKKGKVSISGPVDMSKYIIGVVRDDIGQQLVVDAGYAKDKLDVSSKLASLIKKLERDRVDAIAYNDKVGFYTMKDMGVSLDGYEASYVLSSSQLFYAFNKQTPDAVVKALQDALDAVRASGKADEIAAKYLK